jgi:hypothetical protein
VSVVRLDHLDVERPAEHSRHQGGNVVQHRYAEARVRRRQYGDLVAGLVDRVVVVGGEARRADEQVDPPAHAHRDPLPEAAGAEKSIITCGIRSASSESATVRPVGLDARERARVDADRGTAGAGQRRDHAQPRRLRRQRDHPSPHAAGGAGDRDVNLVGHAHSPRRRGGAEEKDRVRAAECVAS